jgi:hypothetical protein
MDESVMMDHDAARQAGLMMPTKKNCMACHDVKGSHARVLKQPPLDIHQAWQRIKHTTPDVWSYQAPHPFPEPNPSPERPKYAGAEACGACHGGPESGYQFSSWRLSAHARAYAVLSRPAAREIAKEMGRPGGAADQRCLPEVPCHGFPRAGRRKA